MGLVGPVGFKLDGVRFLQTALSVEETFLARTLHWLLLLRAALIELLAALAQPAAATTC